MPELPPQTRANASSNKKASLVLHRAPAEGWGEEQLKEFYKQGFALEDSRDMKDLAEALEESSMERSWTAVREAGLQTVTDMQGNRVKVLWAPILDCYRDYPMSASCNSRGRDSRYLMVIQDGPDKGTVVRYDSYDAARFPVFEDGESREKETDKEEPQVTGEEPKAGGTYVLWFPSLGKAYGEPFIVRDVKREDGLTKINFGDSNSNLSDRLVVHDELEESNESDMVGGANLPRVAGKDVVFVPVKARLEYLSSAPKTPANISWASLTPPASFVPLTAGRMEEALLNTKMARVTLLPVGGGLTDILLNGRRKAEDLGRLSLVVKLARDLHLPAAEALELAERARQSRVEFQIMSPRQRQKMASAWRHEILLKQAAEFDAAEQELGKQAGNALPVLGRASQAMPIIPT